MSTSIIMMMFISSIMFIFMGHPLSFGLVLMIQITLTTLITGLLNFNYWFSYILFLIMIGAMLVLFIYMTSVASNEKFKFSSKLFIFWLIMMLIPISASMIDIFFFSLKNFNSNFINQSIFMNEAFSMNKYMNYPNFLMMILIISYLLISLIAIVKITDIKYGPLRQKF